MKAIVKPATVLGIAGALALGSMTPSQAARVWPWAAAGIGLAAGAAIASAAAYDGYYYGYGPGYDAYAYAPYYAPAPVYSAPIDNYRDRSDHGYDTNYIGPLHERHLEGRDY
jgi:hypothetical protein